MSVPVVGSTKQGPAPEPSLALKYEAALAGVAGEPSSGMASMTTAEGKSAQLDEHFRVVTAQPLIGPLPPEPPEGSVTIAPSSSVTTVPPPAPPEPSAPSGKVVPV